tara:strand:- start:5647 stop:5976 length:330 start_codon:yes stop_codon:yes gene_type:complete
MAQKLITISKRVTFIKIREKGKFIKGKSFNIQYLKNSESKFQIKVGYTATKKLGTAVKRNRAKRIMRELARKVITKYGKTNSYYVLIAKAEIFENSFSSQEIELKKLIS